jgi:hypothetical protein
MLLALLAAPFIAIEAGRRWRTTVLFVMFLMIFEGALRKWVLPGLQGQIYFAKDGLILLALVGFMVERKPGSNTALVGHIHLLLALTGAFCMLQLANPNSPSPLLGLLGIKNYLLYAALFLMVPHIFSSPDDVERKLKTYMLIMIPVALLGLAQFMMPAEHWINAQVTHDIDKETFVSRFGEDNRARASGTFSYIGGFATFIQAMMVFSAAALIGGAKTSRLGWVPLALLLASTLGMFATGSRATLIGSVCMIFTTLLLCLRAGLISGTAAARIVAVLLLATVVVTQFGSEAVTAFEHRAANADDPIMRLLTPFTELIWALDVSPVFGMGIGTNNNAAASLMGDPTLSWLKGHMFELETARVAQEGGLIGFLLVFGTRIAVTLLALRLVGRLRTPIFRALSASIASFSILHLALYVINNPTGGLFYWFAAGLLVAMYRLENPPAPFQGGPAAGMRYRPFLRS